MARRGKAVGRKGQAKPRASYAAKGVGHGGAVDDAALVVAVGRRLKEARKRLGLRRPDVKEAIGLSEPSLFRIEEGRQMPSLCALVALARLYRVSLEDLVPEASASNGCL